MLTASKYLMPFCYRCLLLFFFLLLIIFLSFAWVCGRGGLALLFGYKALYSVTFFPIFFAGRPEGGGPTRVQI